jgi:hypothetical protein
LSLFPRFSPDRGRFCACARENKTAAPAKKTLKNQDFGAGRKNFENLESFLKTLPNYDISGV